MSTEQKTGKVKFFDSEKGFGFIIQDDGSKDLFFHYTETDRNFDPQENDEVEYTIGEGQKGPCAKNVRKR